MPPSAATEHFPTPGRASGPHAPVSWILSGAYVSLDDLARLRIPTARGPSATAAAPWHGERAAPVRGRGMDFDEVRPYQPGDDLRSIDWRVTARKGKPHTKVFREERERPTLIVVDQTRSMFFGSQGRLKSVLAAEIAATTAWRALAAQDRVGGLVLDQSGVRVFKPLRREAAVLRVLAALVEANRALDADPEPGEGASEATTEGGDAWWRLVAPLLRIAGVNHRIVIVSDFLGASATLPDPHGAALDALAGIARHNEVALHFVHDPLERELPPAGRYHVTDGERRESFHSGDGGLRSAYRARFDGHLRTLEQTASRSGMRLTQASTA
ncbi:MAG: DUF58 domain-containing protein [Gammaproteobacteria bacterium]|nr:DUF58 domain-containing protein [Gammaproteobacteria bacterium]